MLKLSLTLAPQWVEMLPGVRLYCAALTGSVLAEARGDAGWQAAAEAGNVPLATHLMARRVAQLLTLDWDGVGDLDGNPVEPTPAWIAALFDARKDVADRFFTAVVQPFLVLDAEKNVSGPLPSGTSAEGQTSTAVPATGSATPVRDDSISP